MITCTLKSDWAAILHKKKNAALYTLNNNSTYKQQPRNEWKLLCLMLFSTDAMKK